ncbi:hypothetical protein [Thermococcus atlanticus]
MKFRKNAREERRSLRIRRHDIPPAAVKEPLNALNSKHRTHEAAKRREKGFDIPNNPGAVITSPKPLQTNAQTPDFSVPSL